MNKQAKELYMEMHPPADELYYEAFDWVSKSWFGRNEYQHVDNPALVLIL